MASHRFKTGVTLYGECHTATGNISIWGNGQNRAYTQGQVTMSNKHRPGTSFLDEYVLVPKAEFDSLAKIVCDHIDEELSGK